jgi:hypothetical protein
VHVKIGLKSRSIVSNRLYRFENTKTWHEVFVEVCDDDFFLRKTDEICVTVSDRSGHSFEPDLEEPIQVVQEFDLALKFATFVVNRYASSSEENDINNEFCIQINSIKTFVCIYNVNIEKKNRDIEVEKLTKVIRKVLSTDRSIYVSIPNLAYYY